MTICDVAYESKGLSSFYHCVILPNSVTHSFCCKYIGLYKAGDQTWDHKAAWDTFGKCGDDIPEAAAKSYGWKVFREIRCLQRLCDWQSQAKEN